MEKSTGAASSASTAPPPKDIIVDLPETLLQLRLGFLAHWTPSQPPQTRKSTPISQKQDWRVIAQWNAFPDIPSYGEVTKRVAQRQKFRWIVGGLGFGLGVVVAGMADGLIAGLFLAFLGFATAGWLFDRLVVPCMLPEPSVWDWDSTRPIRLYWTTRAEEAHFDPHQLFWHPHHPYLFVSKDHCHMTGWYWPASEGHRQISGGQKLFSLGSIKKIFFSDDPFLAISESFRWWEHRPTDHLVLYDSGGNLQTMMTGYGLAMPLQFRGGHLMDLRSNPWRPAHSGEILLRSSWDDLSVSVYHISKLPKTLLFPEAWSRMQEFAKTTINLTKLRHSEKESVGSFAWHPSGFYLAIEISDRLHLLNWDNAELVLCPPQDGEKYEAVAWSPDGTLLALDRTFLKVWDVRTNTIRSLAPHECWEYREEGGIGYWRTFAGEKVTNVARCPYDPDVVATIGGENCPRDIRIWQRAK